MRETLHDIAIRHSPSKLDHPYVKHFYPKFLEKWRDKPVRLLEIGVKRGNSLTMWHEYFPNGQIVGLDHKLSLMNIDLGQYPRIKVASGKQEVPEHMDRALALLDGNLNIVVDDGSHRSNHQLASFKYLFPKMAKKGIYFIEDLMFMSHQVSHKEDGKQVLYGKSWMLDKDGFVTHNDLIDYLSYLLRWPMLGRRYWTKIRASKEDDKIGRLIKAMHFHQHFVAIERN